MSEEIKEQAQAQEQVNVADAVLGNKSAAGKKPFNKQGKRPDRRREDAVPSEYTTKTVDINRITKVTKGGRTLRFAAIVVIGNKNGKVGIGTGKAAEVTEAIRKAEQNAKRNIIEVSIIGTTIPHEFVGIFGTSKVLLLPSSEGNGIIAGGAARTVLELAGYKDVTAKIHGSTNKGNVVRATLNGLTSMRTKAQVAALRGLSEEEF